MLFLLLAGGVSLSTVPESEVLKASSLFHIKISKNANIVQYDLVLDADGRPHPSRPIDVYWLRLAEDGRRRSLKLPEKNLAYGVKVRQPYDGAHLIFTLSGFPKQQIDVKKLGGKWGAFVRRNVETTRLDYLNIVSDESGIVPRVVSVELIGSDSVSGRRVVRQLKD